MRSTPPTIVSLLLALSAPLLGCVDPAAPEDRDPASAEALPARALDETLAPPGARGAGAVEASSSSYPAPHPGMPQIPNNGGAVLRAPRIVTVTFPHDPWREKLEAFGERIGTLAWWSTVHDGYGVGPAASAGHVAIDQAPGASLSDGDVERWLVARIGDRTLPAPTDQSIYVLYYPQATTVTLDDIGGGAASCQVFLGYHATVDVAVQGKTVPVAYAVVNRCGDDFDQLTVTASHELTEASTDPRPTDAASAGWVTLDDNAWTLLGGENGDMCAAVSSVKEAGFTLTRVWNNKTAAAGDQPCQPAPGTGGVPYYNAGIVDERVELDPGASLSTEVDCYSFGPLSAAITLEARPRAEDPLTIALDRETCTNGDKVRLTLTLGAKAAHGVDYHYSLFSSVGEKSSHLWRGMVHVD